MNIKYLLIGLLIVANLPLSALEILRFKANSKDMTPVVRKAIENVKDKDIKLVFEKGIYHFKPDYAKTAYSTITNHGNGMKNIVFSFNDLHAVEIEGNGSEFIFHGQIAPFQLYNIDKIVIKGLTIDWDIPFTFTAELVAYNKDEGWRDMKPLDSEHRWAIKKNKLLFPDIDGFSYDILGSTLPFDPIEKRVVHGAKDVYSQPDKVERRQNGIIRIYEQLDYYPPIGSWWNSKGDRHNDRYAPAFQTKNAHNILFDNVIIHHALGMGFLFERSSDITITNSGVYLRDEKNGKRVISSTADATHFANCKGNILIENSRFENMLDDGTNVHGTYVEVDSVLSEKTVRVTLKHFEQRGFEFAGINDEIWFIHRPDTDRKNVATVEEVSVFNERFIDITFKTKLPNNLRVGDFLENKTWNPNFTMRGNIIRDHRARNIIIKTPGKIVIEDNVMSSMMSSIQLRGESYFWYESGQVADVLIQNNTFDYNAYSYAESAVLYVTPRLSRAFNQHQLYDRNIRFINNTINTFDNRIVWADRVDGIVIKNNTINKKVESDKPPLYPDRPIFEFINSRNIELENNRYSGDIMQAVKADETSAKTLKDDKSIH